MLPEVQAPTFPPLLRGEAAKNPFGHAVAWARQGADPGLVLWAARPEVLEAAMVLAPEDPLERAAGILLAAPLALGDALGSLAPPEVAVHYDWPGGIRVNGGLCGRCRAAAATADPATVPDWLVLGVEMLFLPPEGGEGGERPDKTWLFAEGCGEITPVALLDSWSRHILVWINRFVDDGIAPLHVAWRAHAWGLGENLPDGSGRFIGLDASGGMLVGGDGGSRLRPLTEAFEL